MRLYLVDHATAEEVRSRFDPRLHFVGSLRTDSNGRGALAFTVPPLDSGTYAAAVWCPACARSSRGRTFFVLGLRPETVTRYRPLMLLRVAAQAATAQTCPVTIPNGKRPLGPMPRRHGNGLLWTGLPRDGTVVVDPDRVGPDGSFFWTKLIWIATGVHDGLEVQVQRLDTPAPVLHPVVVSGHLSGWSGPSWAARMRFSSEGCWKVTGRVGDVRLSFVLRVVRPPGA